MLNYIKQSLYYSNKALILFLTLYLSIALCCGKRTPPLPPIERIPQRVQIEGVQRGDAVFLSWTMPARNAADTSTLNIDRVDVYRYAEPSNSSLSLTEGDFSDRSTLISSINVSKNDFGLKKLTYTDKLEFAGQPIRLVYAIRFVNSEGQKAAFSNFLLIEPSAKVAEAPSNLQMRVTEAALVLEWKAPLENVDQSTPVNILGYNVYRVNSKTLEVKLLNAAPITDTRYLDASFQFDEKYEYFVRTVSLGFEGQPVESSSSDRVGIAPKDVFPPTPPTAITIAAAPNALSIFFATNPEKDIAGYKLFRSTDKNLPPSQWELLTPEIISTNTYQDKRVKSGQVYYYYLIAVDKNGNESKPSEIVSETAP